MAHAINGHVGAAMGIAEVFVLLEGLLGYALVGADRPFKPVGGF